jgi:hypothetical protein
MERVQIYIAERQNDWKQNAFFAILASEDDMGFLVDVGRRLTFWTLGFQDVLKVLAGTVRDPQLRVIARHHAAENRDHDLWFLHDLTRMGVGIPSAGDLFHLDHAPARRAAYAILTEAIMARSEPARIALLFALEATGHVFFEATAAFVERMGFEGLKYFSGTPLQVSQQHAIFERKADELLRRWPLDGEAVCEALAVVDSCFDVVDTLFAKILCALPAKEVRLAA